MEQTTDLAWLFLCCTSFVKAFVQEWSRSYPTVCIISLMRNIRIMHEYWSKFILLCDPGREFVNNLAVYKTDF